MTARRDAGADPTAKVVAICARLGHLAPRDIAAALRVSTSWQAALRASVAEIELVGGISRNTFTLGSR